MMTKKIYFLLAFLLTTIGGGNFALAGTYVLNWTNISSSGTKSLTFASGITITNANNNYEQYVGSGYTHYIKINGTTHTIGNIPAGQIVTAVKFEGFKNTDSGTSFIKSFNGTSYTSSTTPHTFGARTADPTSYTFTGLNIASGSFTFAVDAQTDMEITITTEDMTIDNIYSGSYPYTWDFTVDDAKWTKSITQMQTSGEGNNWAVNTTDGNAHPTMLLDVSISLDDIDIIRGLRFVTSSDASNLTLNWTSKYLHLYGYVTIPNVKVGQTITFVSSSDVVANNYGTGRVSGGTGKVFQVTTSGDVQFTVNANIYSISVTKSDIENFRLEGGQGYIHDGISRANIFTWPYGATPSPGNFNFKVSNGSGATEVGVLKDETNNQDGIVVNTDNFSISSDNLSVVSGVSFDHQSGDAKQRRLRWTGVTFGNPGEANITFTFNGNDQYNSKIYAQKFTVTKLEQVLTFAESSTSVNFVQDGTIPNTATMTVNQKFADDYRNNVTSTYGGTSITYSSSNTNVATVNASTGEITMKNSGTTIITATAPANEIYESATARYTLTVNGSTNPTITMKKGDDDVSENGTVETTFGSSVTVTGTSSAGLTVKYRSEDTSIATVDASGKIETKNGGTVKIYVYTEGSGDNNPVETYYNLSILPTSFSLKFLPESGTINVGKTITPYTTFPSIYTEDVTSITASSTNEGVATVVTTLWDKNASPADYSNLVVAVESDGRHKIMALKPTITGMSAGTATITLQFSSAQYSLTSATYDVTVVAGDGLNFDWADKSDLTMYEGDYMMMPAITGNANGYPFDQNDEQRYVWAMTQDNTHVTWISWYNTNYHPGEGEPFYWLTDGDRPDNDKLAYILYAQSSEARTGTHPEGLMIYARKAGTVEIHAKDMQLNQELGSTITLNILPKANIYGNKDNGDESDGLLTVEQKSITYPYTWDFTRDFTAEEKTALDANSYYWTKSGVNYTNGLALQNSDYGDDNHSGNQKNQGSDRLYKAVLANDKTIPAFKGMTVQLQGTYFNSKYDKITLKPTAGDGKSHLHVNGGPQYFQLPAPATSGTDPESYRVYVKAMPTQIGRGEIRLIPGGNNSYWFENAKGQFNDDGIYWAPVVRGQDIKVAFQDVDVFWIAVSTEAKSIGTAAGGSDHMASYSYSQTMDYGKSFEANEVDAYVATEVTNEGSASNPALKVTLQKSNTSVPSGTGVVLKAAAAKDAYMIADARNVDSYNNPEAPTTNLLRGTGNGCTIYELAGDETGTTSGSSHVPFYLSSKFRDYSVGSGIGDQQNAGYYAYWRVYGTQSMPANYSYLVLDAATYKDHYGKPADINEGAASRIMLAFDDSDDDSGTTGIDNVRETTIDSEAWYTLQGVQVNAPAKGGIYIHKGKKVVVK